MLATILGILWVVVKIILWMLLIVLGIVLLLVLIILFVPIGYEVEGNKYEQMQAQGKVTYLFRLIRGTFFYSPKGYGYKVKVLFFTVVKDEVSLEKTAEVESQEVLENPEPPQSSVKEEGPPKGQQRKDTSDKMEQAKPEIKEKEKPIDTKPIDQKPKAEKSKAKKKKVKKEKIPKEGESGFDKVKRFYGFLREEKNVGVLRFILRKTMKALGSILPKRFQGKVHFGLDDPAMTAYLLGAVSAFYPKYKNQLVITSDFETPILEGDIAVKGRILPCVFVWLVLRLLLDGRVRRLIKEVRK